MANSKRTLITLTILFLLIQGAIMVGLALQGQFQYIRSIAGPTCLWLLYCFLESRYSLLMNTFVRVLVQLSLIMDAFFGYYLNLYVTSTIFDKLLHFFETYALSLWAYLLIFQKLKPPHSKVIKFILVLSLGMGMGAFYEILEFLTDQLLHPQPPSQPSLEDTNLDLIANMIGAILSSLYAISRNFINRQI